MREGGRRRMDHWVIEEEERSDDIVMSYCMFCFHSIFVICYCIIVILIHVVNL